MISYQGLVRTFPKRYGKPSPIKMRELYALVYNRHLFTMRRKDGAPE